MCLEFPIGAQLVGRSLEIAGELLNGLDVALLGGFGKVAALGLLEHHLS